METQNLLAVFFRAIENDHRISITHIGIYASLLQYWQKENCPVPMRVFSHQIMEIAKISATKTYHKCVRDLHQYGYIVYHASFKRNQGSEIYLNKS